MRIRPITVAVSLLLVAAASELSRADDYLAEDARLIAGEMHTFDADGREVSVIIGRFELSVGKRRFSGRNGVMWIDEKTVGSRTLRDILLYIDREAEAVEEGGTTTRDKSLIISIRQKGAFRASVEVSSDTSLAGMGLYRRAEQTRRRYLAGESEPPGPTAPTAPETPTALVRPPVAVERPADLAPPKPLSLQADSWSLMESDGVQIFICKGGVRLIQGAPEAADSVTMQADAAVVFRRVAKAGQSVEAPPAGPAGITIENVDSVYLEGDVVLQSGNRSIRGEQLYYDFRNWRATILDAVVRIVHAHRNIPIYVRATEARQLSRREMWFRDATVSTSDFKTPSYAVAAGRAYLMDTTPRDQEGEPLGEESLRATLRNTTFEIRGVPVLWLPYLTADGETGTTSLNRVQLGNHGRFGFGGETEWFLFRLLGLVQPEGFRGIFHLDAYRRATGTGVDLKYARDTFSGYLLAYGVHDNTREDDFGLVRKDIPAPEWRGRVTLRHKQYLQDQLKDWQLQLEVSYLCDRNFLEEFYRDEFWAGKDQDTLLYAKKQRDNWAFTALIQAQINNFQTGPGAAPDLGFFLIGEPLLGDALTLYSESHLGMVGWQGGDGTGDQSSDPTARADQRLEVQFPTHLGPLNLTTYLMGRATYWSDSVDGNDLMRWYGGGGLKANMHIWRVYDNAESRLLDIHRLKHVITPEVNVFATASNVAASRTWPFTPGIETHLESFQGVAVGVKQRWQTYRGREGQQHVVDFARLNVWLMYFNDSKDLDQPAGGQWFFDRPEYSITRDSINADLALNISDSTVLMADANYDIGNGDLALGNVGLAVQRNPRLKYYLGMRYADPLDSAVGTFGFNYRVNRKYQVSLFQQYDFADNDGKNLSTRVSVVRKWPRWFSAVTFVYDRTNDDVGVVLTFWPEGIPEVRIGGLKLGTGWSDLN